MQTSERVLFDVVCDVLRREFEVPESALRREARLADDLDLDSLDAVSLEAALESQLGAPVELGDPKQLRTLGDVVARVAECAEPTRGSA